MMKIKHAPTIRYDIFIAGDYTQAKQVCRAFCLDVGLCVHVEQVDFIYTGGEESGVKIGLINYPRFPAEPEVVEGKARQLAKALLEGLHQHSYSIVGPEQTEWFTRREDAR